MMGRLNRQRGATLLVTLVMLVVLTLFVVSGINLSSTNLKIIGNMQSQQAMEAVADQAVQQVISTIAPFNAPAAQEVPLGAYKVTVSKPVCVNSVTAEGYSAKDPLAPEDTNWDVQASVTDPSTGATVTLHQGVSVRMARDSCPAS